MSQEVGHAELREKTQQLLHGALKHVRAAALAAALVPLGAVAVSPAVALDGCSSGTGSRPTSDVVTEIHREPDHTIVGSVTMGATIRDKATVTVTNGKIPPGSRVTFNRFNNGNCSAPPATSQVVNLTSTGNLCTEMVDPSNSYLVLATNIPALSYQAVFTSGSTSVPNAASDCEPLDVHSSITGFSYQLVDARSNRVVVDNNNNTGPFTCVLEQKVGGVCPPGTSEATVPVGTTETYQVTVEVSNQTGATITEKVRGGLAAKARHKDGDGIALKPVNDVIKLSTVTCGAATINLSRAKTGSGNTGNVVIWNANASTNPADPGFTMGNNTMCTLTVEVAKKFKSCGEQPVTSSWSELQTLVDGPNAGFSEKSPHTGSLSVKVVGCPQASHERHEGEDRKKVPPDGRCSEEDSRDSDVPRRSKECLEERARDDGARKAHEAARCANEQGKSNPHHDEIDEREQRGRPTQLRQHARELGLHGAAFEECLASGKDQRAERRDHEE